MESQLELFYEIVNEAIEYLIEKVDKTYLELLEIVLNDISNVEINNMFSKEDTLFLENHYQKLSDKDFSVTEIKDACDFLLINGFKQDGIKYFITPKRISMLFCYLISRLTKKEKISVLDPLCGYGSLILATYSNLDKEVMLYAIEHNDKIINLCSSISRVMSCDVNLYLQDTFSLVLPQIDFVISDLINYENVDDNSFTLEVVKHHKYSLADDGIFMFLANTNFLSSLKKEDIVNGVLDLLSLVGMIELPDGMFIGKPKSIFIFKKTKKFDKKALMVKLPSFSKAKEFNKIIYQIETWFEDFK